MSADAILLVSFGGPEGRDDVIPFLENVLRGRRVSPERMLEVAEHYYHFDGVSPMNSQNRRLIAAVEEELSQHDIQLPVYWGNRNWHPLLTDTLRQMRNDGIQRALAFFTSTFSSYSGCRQYREHIELALDELGERAPRVEKLRMGFNHPGFIEAMADRVNHALRQVPAKRRNKAAIVFTAHSIPVAMAKWCDYERQLWESCQLIVDKIQHQRWTLAFQSRSGLPSQPWLEPDVNDYLRTVSAQSNSKDIVIAPIGFVSDHMEVIFDLDIEAKQTCDELGLRMVRAKTVGTHPKFVSMIRQLIEERISDTADRLFLGDLGASHDVCPIDCCLSGRGN